MLREEQSCFSSVKEFLRDKRGSPVGRKSHVSKREFYPAHGYGTGPGIVFLAKVKWVKLGIPAAGRKKNISQAVQPSPSTRVGASRDERHPQERKAEEARSPAPAVRGVSPWTQNSFERSWQTQRTPPGSGGEMPSDVLPVPPESAPQGSLSSSPRFGHRRHRGEAAEPDGGSGSAGAQRTGGPGVVGAGVSAMLLPENGARSTGGTLTCVYVGRDRDGDNFGKGIQVGNRTGGSGLLSHRKDFS